MKYQDLKLRDAARVAAIGAVCTLFAVAALIWPEATRQAVEPLPLSKHGDDYVVWLGVTAIAGAMCWFVVAQYLLRAPEDDARTVAKLVAGNKPLPAKFNPALLDAADPNFAVPTWRYALTRWKGSQRN